MADVLTLGATMQIGHCKNANYYTTVLGFQGVCILVKASVRNGLSSSSNDVLSNTQKLVELGVHLRIGFEPQAAVIRLSLEGLMCFPGRCVDCQSMCAVSPSAQRDTLVV